ncbi:MAG: iron-containing alcohol dehydrogenase [Paracoccaceae bacterium]
MTLITYPTRAHFADDVLEEALFSELERIDHKSALLIAGISNNSTDFEERVLAGLPRQTQRTLLYFEDREDKIPVTDLSNFAKSKLDDMQDGPQIDVIIAFGSARAIELGRKCRRVLSERQKHRLPFFAIPGWDGLPNPCMRQIESWLTGLPTVLICDPTVALGTMPERNLRACVLSLVRCIESYLANAFNPPADGMALDGLQRCIKSIPKIGQSSDLKLQRDLMAACLNAAMAQEKGIGPSLTLVNALEAGSHSVQTADAARLILPKVLRERELDADKSAVLRQLFHKEHSHASTPGNLADVIDWCLPDSPLAPRLADMGLTNSDLTKAAHNVAGQAGFNYDQARAVLDAVY